MLSKKEKKKGCCPSTQAIKDRHQKFRDFLKNIQKNQTPSTEKVGDLHQQLNPTSLPLFTTKQ